MTMCDNEQALYPLLQYQASAAKPWYPDAYRKHNLSLAA